VVNALVVYAHPCEDSFVAAACERVVTTLRERGHRTVLVDLYADGFDAVFTAADHATHQDPPGGKVHVAPYAPILRSCDTLVLVYPTWWAAQPAILKGWFDRVWVNGLAFSFANDGRLVPGLRNIRRIIAVTTHGSSKWVNAIEGESGKRILGRSLRACCARTCRTKWLALYGLDTAPMERRAAFLDRVTRYFARLR
jgi:putative NADPH-quinone reductase